jgi:hypothetical protein
MTHPVGRLSLPQDQAVVNLAMVMPEAGTPTLVSDCHFHFTSC